MGKKYRIYLPADQLDWSPLAGIAPHRNGRGWSLFTIDEGERIREFYRNNRVSMSTIARHLTVNVKSIGRVIQRDTKYTRQPRKPPGTKRYESQRYVRKVDRILEHA